MRIAFENGEAAKQSRELCVATWLLWIFEAAISLGSWLLLEGGNMGAGAEWLAVQTGRDVGGVAGSGRGSGPSWGWQQAAQWMKAGQVMCGWRGGTLLLLRQMPRLLGLISSAKHHPVLARNKFKCLWPVCVFLFVSVCASIERKRTVWFCIRVYQEHRQAEQ